MQTCKNSSGEFCQDSCQSIGDLPNWKDRLTKTRETGKQKPVFYIVVADVEVLQPRLCRDTVTKAFECELEKHSNFNTKARATFVELNKM